MIIAETRFNILKSTRSIASLVGYFKREGSAAIRFAKYLLLKYFLPGQRARTCLVFLGEGATPLEALTRHLAAANVILDIKGIVLKSDFVARRNNQPLIVERLLRSGILAYDKIVFVDTGYRGNTARFVINMLHDHRLLSFIESQYGLSLPKKEWDLAIELLCLRNKEAYSSEYEIEGFNYVEGAPHSMLHDRLAFVIDENPHRKLLANALIQASRSISP